MQRLTNCVLAAAVAVALAGAAAAPATAKSSGGHGSSHSGPSSHTTASAPRDASSGLATGKRMHKPYTARAKSFGGKKLTPEKVEAGSENVRR